MTVSAKQRTDDWADRLDEVSRSVDAATAGDHAPVVGFDDLGPLPDELRQRATELLGRLDEIEVAVARRLEEIDRSLRLDAPAARPWGDHSPAPAYLDHLA